MRYLSTRGGEPVRAAEAIVRGISPSGGLYVPEEYPQIQVETGERGSYQATALRIMQAYFPEAEESALKGMISAAYASFGAKEVTPLVQLTGAESVLELWHGPTMAFKDVALQMLPHLMLESLRQTGEQKRVYILVATSGDTGKAALEGFRDVPGTRVLGVLTRMGEYRKRSASKWSPRRAAIWTSAPCTATLTTRRRLSSRFSPQRRSPISWISSAGGFRARTSLTYGRLLPQIVYYYTSYQTLLERGAIQPGESVNFCVPTGNFGDILAGEYARADGAADSQALCASNATTCSRNSLRGGVYDDKRPFYKSMSCSIDILISSNLERLLFELAGRDDAIVRGWMKDLKDKGMYALPQEALDEMSKVFAADWCTEEDTLDTIRRVYGETGYLMDPHTAVAQCVYERYVERTGDNTKTVLLSTANPYKFATDVLGAFEPAGSDDFSNVDRLFALTKAPVPKGISGLKGKPERHLDVRALEELPARVLSPVTD